MIPFYSDKNAPCCRSCQLVHRGIICRESQPSACKKEAFCSYPFSFKTSFRNISYYFQKVTNSFCSTVLYMTLNKLKILHTYLLSDTS